MTKTFEEAFAREVEKHNGFCPDCGADTLRNELHAEDCVLLLKPIPLQSLHSPGAKDDHHKPIAGELVIAFPRAMEALVEVASYGARKYSRHGFLQVEDAQRRYTDAMMRHLLKHGAGEERDPESGMPHLWHALWNVAAMVELKERER